MQKSRLPAIPVPLRRPGRALAEPGGRPYSACYAPMVQLYFDPDGEVRACCRNVAHPLGNVAAEPLREIWAGARRRALVDHLAVDDWSLGCQGCGTEVAQEGRESSYPASFDGRAVRLQGEGAATAWPSFMEFNLSNACNLQCIQCNGDLSSSIRIHRERRAPLAKVYGDEFFEDLAAFLPHLDEAQFAGGEPFLGAENFRAWELIAEVAPSLGCTVVTNATQWNRRVERVLEQLPMSFTFSIDGVTRETYESIRVDADFDEVMANLDRFCDYAHGRGTRLAINYCLMVQNHHEFADMLLFAEARDIRVNVSVVHHPGHCSIARLPHDEMLEVHRLLQARSATVAPQLRLNADTWRRELARIASWVETGAASDTHDSQWAASAYDILDLPRQGAGPTSDEAARLDISAFAGDEVVQVVSVGPDDLIRECVGSPLEFFGVDAADLIGLPASRLRDALTARYGTMTEYQVLADGPDRVDALARCGDREFRLSMVAVRDTRGWADEGRILVGSRPRPA